MKSGAANGSNGLEDDPDLIVRDWYDHHYSQVSATADGSFFHKYMHRAMERRFGERDTFERVLEVGGNRGEHVEYVKHGFTEYVLTDLFAPKLIPALETDARIRTQACDVADIPYETGAFDRVIATCLLHHVDSPFRAAHEMRRVTKDGGVITILVPTDPGLAYRVGKAVTSGRAARREGLADRHRLLAALDHPNHFWSIKQQVRHVFRNDAVVIDWLPWRVPSLSLNAFTVFTITKSADR
jgi:SAM-dependent methyltransferase